MRTKTTVHNIQEATIELKKQLEDKDFYLHNYSLLSNIEDYLDKCKDSEDFDKGEQIFNFLAYDLKWEDRSEELFPMEL